MKLARRLGAATAATVFLTAAAGGALLLQLEQAQLVANARHETRLLARSIQVSVENAMRDRQQPDVVELIDRLELVARQVDVMVFAHPGGELLQASPGSVPFADDEQRLWSASVASGEVLQVVDPTGRGPRLIVAAPLRTDLGERIGTLVVSRPLDELEADLRATNRMLVVAIGSFAAVTVLIMLMLLRRHVTGPLARLTRATESLGRTLDAPLDLSAHGDDEIAHVARALIDVQRRLRQARDERARDAASREAFEQALRAADKQIVLGQLAAGVAHEVGSPLQILVGRAQLLAEGGHGDEVSRQARLIGEHASRIAAIVERLQDLVRRRPSRPRAIDLAEQVAKVSWLLEPEARKRGVALEWSASDAPVVHADPDEVQQVALNLMLNALQSGARAVKVAVERLGPDVALTVEDDGRGIPPDAAPRVFDAFYTTRQDDGGTGLGLAVVRSLVDRQRAEIAIESPPGGGTRVVVRWRHHPPDEATR